MFLFVLLKGTEIMNKSKRVFLVFAVCVSFLMSSCKNDEIKIGAFNEFPSEIDGCSCYFSANQKEFKQKKYIYVDDYLDNAYLIINGKKIKFKSIKASVSANGKDVHWIKKFKSNDYQITVETFQTGEIDETSQEKGTITIKSTDGNQVVKTFVGECGC